eukprot:3363215-Rhodomonas_salina.2
MQFRSFSVSFLFVLLATTAFAFAPMKGPGLTQNIGFARPGLTCAQAKAKAKKRAPPSKGGGFGKKQMAPEAESACDKAARAKKRQVVDNPGDARAWLELGAVLVKLGDYAEAEEVFRLGNICAPGDEMMSGAYVSIAGQSSLYFGGETSRPEDPNARLCPFDTYEVGQPVMDFRTVSWSTNPRVQVSSAPLISKEECARAIQDTENWAAENGGWMSDRHVQAATTDLAVKDVPKLLHWFNEKLETLLFPMLVSRYPDKINSIEDIRVHDAFIVKYDATG